MNNTLRVLRVSLFAIPVGAALFIGMWLALLGSDDSGVTGLVGGSLLLAVFTAIVCVIFLDTSTSRLAAAALIMIGAPFTWFVLLVVALAGGN